MEGEKDLVRDRGIKRKGEMFGKYLECLGRMSWATDFSFKTRGQDKKMEVVSGKSKVKRDLKGSWWAAPAPQEGRTQDQELTVRRREHWGRAGKCGASVTGSVGRHKLEKKALDPAERSEPLHV